MKKLIQKIVSEVLKYKKEIAIAAFIAALVVVGVMMTKPKAQVITPVEEPAVVVEVVVEEISDSIKVKDD